VGWIHLTQDNDQWGAVVNAVVNLWFHKMREDSGLCEQVTASQEGLYSVEWLI
jgi:hypothetical protein